MKLNESQIQELNSFTKKKGIEYIDLQDELVDHLVCAIEDELSKDPTLTFEKVFLVEYKKFGVFGFDGVLMERTSQLEKKALRMFFSDLLSFFKIPKIFFTICLFISLYYLMSFSNLVEIVYYGVGLAALTLMLYNLFVRFKNIKETSRKYLVAHQYHFLTRSIGSFFYWIVVCPIFIRDGALLENPLICSIILTFIVLVVLIAKEQLENLETYMEENYSVSA